MSRRFGIDRVFERRLAALINGGQPQILQGGRKGVEKESLRVEPSGALAQTMHPRLLGSALTNEHITTDYSESLIELVTPAFTTSWELLQYLLDLHQFVYRHLGDELLWATSMPGAIERDEDIPIAQFGSSHVGQMKTIYRRGLGLRYGRMMQAISGVHFNYSFPLSFWKPTRTCSRSTITAHNSCRLAISTCCATTGATAGSCCICLASHRSSASLFSRAVTSRCRNSRATPHTSPTPRACG